MQIEFFEESPWDTWISQPYLVIYEDGSVVTPAVPSAQSAVTPPSTAPSSAASGRSWWRQPIGLGRWVGLILPLP